MFVVSSGSISPTTPDVVAGKTITFRCTAIITGRGGTPSFTWTGQVSRGPQQGQTVRESTNTFTDMLTIRVSQHNPSVQCMASVGMSTLITMATLSVSGNFVLSYVGLNYSFFTLLHSSPNISKHYRE